MNLSTWIILLILAVIVGAVVRVMIKDKKSGRGCGGCAGGCPGCSGASGSFGSSGSMCHGPQDHSGMDSGKDSGK